MQHSNAELCSLLSRLFAKLSLMGVATTEFRVHKCKINKDLDYGLRWSEPATALSYKLRQRAMRAANEASVRSTCRMPAISFAFE